MIKSPISQFVKDSVSELKQVVWPTRKTVIRLTLVVILVSLFTGLLIGGLDYLFLNLIGLIVK
ncbi:MAG: preprotein translocase subunit SecE [Candidatus Beckwithbacteria bacterium]